MDEPDKLTETRGSIEIKSSFISKLSKVFCPCLSTYEEDRTNTDYFASDIGNDSDRQPNVKEFQMPMKGAFTLSPINYNFKYTDETENSEEIANRSYQEDVKAFKSKSFIQSTHRQVENFSLFKQMSNMTYTKKAEWKSYPVFRFYEGELNLVGKKNRSLLVEVSTVKLEPSPCAIQKQFQSKPSSDKSTDIKCEILDDFWKVRYFYFQKFDEGVQIDDESLHNLTPEIVSDYIAGKCFDCKVALDAFSGIGHNATKLGTFCEKVICVEEEVKKYNYLINNSKIYQIYNIELFLKPFLEIEVKNPVDVVVLHPYACSQTSINSSVCQLKNFTPDLRECIRKSLGIAHNLVMLLPANINVRDICYQISSCAHEMSRALNTCSLKIEKIYFRGNFSYLAVFFGPSVCVDVNLNSELSEIYKMLKAPGEKTFEYRRLIKHIREKFGMIKLLNFILESKDEKYGGEVPIEKFINYVRCHQLVLEHKLHKIINEERSFHSKDSLTKANSFSSNFTLSENEKKVIFETAEDHEGYAIEEENLEELENGQNEEEATQTERTQSFVSNASGFSSFHKKRATLKSVTSEQEKSDTSSIYIKKISPQTMEQCKIDERVSKSPATTHINGVSLNNRGSVNVETNRANLFASEKDKLRKGLLGSAHNSRYEI